MEHDDLLTDEGRDTGDRSEELNEIYHTPENVSALLCSAVERNAYCTLCRIDGKQRYSSHNSNDVCQKPQHKHLPSLMYRAFRK
jgi:hypothetical protein